MIAKCYNPDCPFYEPNRNCSAADGCGGYTAPTNADRIRAMSDEELAAVLVLGPMEEKIPFCQNKPECYKLLGEDRDIPGEMCAECMLDWLKQEVKE